MKRRGKSTTPRLTFFALCAAIGAAIGAGGCRRGTPDVTVAASGQDSRTSELSIRITEDPSARRWSVEYRFREPVNRLVFLSDRNLFRADQWVIETPGFAWTRDGTHEVIQSSGAAVTSLRLSFVSDEATKPKDYELNVVASEGSGLLYTGHLAAVACLDDCTQALAEADAITADWSFASSPERIIAAGGQLQRGALGLAATPLGESGYVYFGGIEPLATARAQIIVDPGMPAALVEQCEAVLPRLFGDYEANMGVELPSAPLLFISWGGAERGGRSMGGGVAQDVVQLAISGAGWTQASSETSLAWFRFVAHEVMHLWNAQMFEPASRVDEWIAEGGADLFALRAMRDLGVGSERDYRAQIVEAANRCILRLEGRPLTTVLEQGDVETFYTCGAMAMFALDLRVQALTEGRLGIDDVFARMYAELQARGERRYDTAALLATAVALAGAPAIAEVEAITGGLQHDTDLFFARIFADAEWPVTRREDLAGSIDRELLIKTLAHKLARCDCGLRRNFALRPGYLEFLPAEQCDTMAQGVQVTALDGASVIEAPEVALRKALDDMREQRAITLETTAGTRVQLRCPDGYQDASFSSLLLLEQAPD